MNTKVLCVDDEPNVLYGYKRTIRKGFDIFIAESGEAGLALIASEGPFAVVVSDMRMPVMDGIQFLRHVKEFAPETVRMMLTGNSDQQTAMDAVNEGSIFRFLTKPCSPETLAITLDAAIEQYRLVTAEKQLLEETLNKSLQVMVDILSMVNPTAFNRSTRLKKIARGVADQLNIKNGWEVEIAAMLSQIGCITVPEDVLEKIAKGLPLDHNEVTLYHQIPQTGHDLISRIPRMESVAEMVGNQNRRIDDEGDAGTEASIVGSRILKAVLDFDKLRNSGNSITNAYHELMGREGWYDATVLDALKDVVEIGDVAYESVGLSVSDLKPGMVLDRPLVSLRGQTLLSEGQEVTMSLILRLMSFAELGLIDDTVRVLVPAGELQPA